MSFFPRNRIDKTVYTVTGLDGFYIFKMLATLGRKIYDNFDIIFFKEKHMFMKYTCSLMMIDLFERYIT